MESWALQLLLECALVMTKEIILFELHLKWVNLKVLNHEKLKQQDKTLQLPETKMCPAHCTLSSSRMTVTSYLTCSLARLWAPQVVNKPEFGVLCKWTHRSKLSAPAVKTDPTWWADDTFDLELLKWFRKLDFWKRDHQSIAFVQEEGLVPVCFHSDDSRIMRYGAHARAHTRVTRATENRGQSRR